MGYHLEVGLYYFFFYFFCMDFTPHDPTPTIQALAPGWQEYTTPLLLLLYDTTSMLY